MTAKLEERWRFRENILPTIEDLGKLGVKITGKAAMGNVVSKNRRKYLDEELTKSARTWIGRPITINHSPPREDMRGYDKTKIAGDIRWMEYEDGLMKYAGVVRKEPYVGLLRSKSTEIKGVSIEADYVTNECPKCGKCFDTDDLYYEHTEKEHFIKNLEKVPRGIMGSALSLVLSPEEPGIEGTTIELMETARDGVKPFSQLAEKLTNQKEEQEKMANKELEGKVAIEKPTMIPWNIDKLKETPTKTEPLTVTVPSGAHVVADGAVTPIPLVNVCQDNKMVEPLIPVPIKEVKLKEVKAPPKLNLNEDAPKLKLGEPFGGYTDFADCVAKNQDKENPEAYCGSIKHEVEGEMFFRKRVVEIVNLMTENMPTIHENIETLRSLLVETMARIKPDDVSWSQKCDELSKRLAGIPNDDLGWKTEIDAIKAEAKKQADELAPKIEDLKTMTAKSLVEMQAKFDENTKAYQTLLAEADKHNLDLKAQKDKLELAVAEFKQAEEKKVKETADAMKVAEEAKTIAENTADKMKGQFKGKSNLKEKTETEEPQNPLTNRG